MTVEEAEEMEVYPVRKKKRRAAELKIREPEAIR